MDETTQACYWELQKFLALALKANPNLLEKSTLNDADLVFHQGEYQRLRAMLEQAIQDTKLPEMPSSRDALNDLLVLFCSLRIDPQAVTVRCAACSSRWATPSPRNRNHWMRVSSNGARANVLR